MEINNNIWYTELHNIQYFRAYGNAVPDNLWAALQEQVDQDGINLPYSIKAFMDTWISKNGYPVITVTRNYTSNGAVISQV